MSEPNIRSALAEHLGAYARGHHQRVAPVVHAARAARRGAGCRGVAGEADSAGRHLRRHPFQLEHAVSMVGCRRHPGGVRPRRCVGRWLRAGSLRTRIAPPWAILAEEVATDLRGLPGTSPECGIRRADRAGPGARTSGDSRAAVAGRFARPAGCGRGSARRARDRCAAADDAAASSSEGWRMGMMLTLGLAAAADAGGARLERPARLSGLRVDPDLRRRQVLCLPRLRPRVAATGCCRGAGRGCRSA